MLKKELQTAWTAVMDEGENPLRRTSLMTAHMVMQLLAWMWCAIFSVALGSYLFFGVSVVGHALIIAGIVITIAVFRRADSDKN